MIPRIPFLIPLNSFIKMIDIFDNFYKGKRVLVTGHTGFKGSGFPFGFMNLVPMLSVLVWNHILVKTIMSCLVLAIR